jgi:hypothetical protein
MWLGEVGSGHGSINVLLGVLVKLLFLAVFIFLLVEEGGVVLILHLLRGWAAQPVLFSGYGAACFLVVATCTQAERPVK